ncbi:MAG: hypothetical protein R3B13_05425 [Polyangiaceae bacterium]
MKWNLTNFRRRSLLVLAAGGLVAAIASVPRAADADPSKASRYPYDPVCDWGRVSNGKGMLVRCLSQAEAASLASGAAPTPTASASATPSSSTPLKADVVGVTADEGDLPGAQKKLREANAKYAECVEKEGGLSATRGEVHVRFLVRARGRAEGVSVAKRVGVSESAARCVAHVVDRRWVGTPAAPIVGGTAVIRLEKR